MKNYGGDIPPDAVPAGSTRYREMLYVGRVHHVGSLTVGKVNYRYFFMWQLSIFVALQVHPSHGVLYIPYGGKEHGYREYEILVYR